MAIVDDLKALLADLSPEEKASLAATLGVSAPASAPSAPAPTEKTPDELELDRLQDEVATLAGSERAATEPGSIAQEFDELHGRIHELQVRLGHSSPRTDELAELRDQVQSLQVKVANLERAQVVVTHDPVQPQSSA